MNYQELCNKFFFDAETANICLRIGAYMVYMVKIPISVTLTAIYHMATWCGDTENATFNMPQKEMRLLTMIAHNNTIVIQPIPNFYIDPADEWADMTNGNIATSNAERILQEAKKLITDAEVEEAEIHDRLFVDAAAKNFFNGKHLNNVYTPLIRDMVHLDNAFMDCVQYLPDYEAAAKAWLTTGNHRRVLAKDMKLEREARVLTEKWEAEPYGDTYQLREIKRLTDGMKNVTVKLATADDSVTVKIPTLAFSWKVNRGGNDYFLEPFVDLWMITPEREMCRVCNVMKTTDVPIGKVLEIAYRGKTIYKR